MTTAETGTHVTTLGLRARRARELAWIHEAVCRARRQSLLCSTCLDLNARASLLEVEAIRAVSQ